MKHSLPTAAAGSWIYHQLFLLLLFIKLVINIMIVLPHKGKKAITRLLDQLSHHCNSPLWLYTPPSPTTLSLQIHLEVQNRNIEIYILILIIYYRNMNFLLSVYTPQSPTTLSLQIHLEVQNRNIETYIYISWYWSYIIEIWTFYCQSTQCTPPSPNIVLWQKNGKMTHK